VSRAPRPAQPAPPPVFLSASFAGPIRPLEFDADFVYLQTKHRARRTGAVEWANQASAYLPEDKVRLLKSWIVEAVKSDLQEMQKAQKELETALEALIAASNAPSPEVKLEGVSPVMSVAKLLREFVSQNPGKTSTEYIEMMRRVKGDATKPEDVHSGLYKLSKPGGPLRKTDEKPVRYYLVDAIDKEFEEA
jgi:hypothetical protein